MSELLLHYGELWLATANAFRAAGIDHDPAVRGRAAATIRLAVTERIGW